MSPSLSSGKSRPASTHAGRVLLICTTYPARTETFVRREVEAMRALGVELDVVSVWGGGGGNVRRFRFWELVKLFWWLPYWLARRPRSLCELMQAMLLRPMPSTLNVGENLLGFGFALIRARSISSRRYSHAHAVWAGLPAAAAWLLERLTGLPYSLGAHAYDLYEGGGDWLLPEKAAGARFVRTSTVAGGRRLQSLGLPAERILVVRRGLVDFPAVRAVRPKRVPLRILAVGRFVEKMGYHNLIQILRAARSAGLAFEARLFGDGPRRNDVARRIKAFQLGDRVRLEGHQPIDRILEAFRWADVLLFTGVVSRNGDRAGLPNVVAEAMASGVPVVASRVGGVTEAVAHESTGLLAEGPEAIDALRRLAFDDVLYARLRRGGLDWIRAHFDARQNMRRLIDQMLPPPENRSG